MEKIAFDYEQICMGVRETRPKSYRISFPQDYRLHSLRRVIPNGRIKILDIGCGGGMLTESLPYYFPKASIHGCDISKTAVSYAKKYGSGNVRYGVIRGKRFPYASGSFDVCICLDVLEHVPDINFFLREVKRVLRKEGKFFLIVPCEGEPYTYTWLLRKLHWNEHITYKYFGHIHPEFTHEMIIRLLKQHDFYIENIRYSEHVIYQILEWISYFIPKILLEYLFGESAANQYSDSQVVRGVQGKNGVLLLIRKLWLWCMRVLRYGMYWETRMCSQVPFAAWKIHVLARKM